MEIKKQQCSRCHKTGDTIESKNPFVGVICFDCLSEIIDFDSIEDVATMSKTLQVNFNPNQFYMASMATDNKKEALKEYFEYLKESNNDPGLGKLTAWHDIDQEWKQIKSYHELMMAMPKFRDEFVRRNQAKWGYNFTSFDQLMQLENLYTSTLKSYNISDPLRKDAIKKAAIVSLKIDESIFAGDGKELKELTAAYQNFLKIAKIEEFATAADDGTIRTVADLVSYLERNGYYIKSTVKERQDIVDMTLDNILENTRIILSEATGLDLQIKDIIEKAKDTMEAEYSSGVYEREPLVEDYFGEAEVDLERELQEEESIGLDEISSLFI